MAYNILDKAGGRPILAGPGGRPLLNAADAGGSTGSGTGGTGTGTGGTTGGTALPGALTLTIQARVPRAWSKPFQRAWAAEEV